MFYIKVSYSRACQGLQRMVGIIYGDWESSYVELLKYLKAVQSSNHGTVYDVIHTFDIFYGAFWAFGPSNDGFTHRCPLFFYWHTRLYGKYLVRYL